MKIQNFKFFIFENKENKILINKKYVIWYDCDDCENYEILNITETTYDPDIRYWSRTIYQYNSDSDTLEYFSNRATKFFRNIDIDYVIYQSNDLEKVKNKLELIISTNKYNL